MKEFLANLEQQIGPYAKPTALEEAILLQFPEKLRQLHSYKVFGGDLLAIPANIKNNGDDDEFEIPFRFLETKQELNIFEGEFRSIVPEAFIPIGYLCETEVVLLNISNNYVYVFHVADFADVNWLQYKLQRALCTWEIFVKSLRPQTVCCFINPNKYSEYDIFEIRNKTRLISYSEDVQFATEEEAWKEYDKFIQASVNKGFELHYAPKRVVEALQP